MLTEEQIKQIYFQTDERTPGTLVASEVDLVGFAHRVEAAVAKVYADKERAACLEFVKSLNVYVAQALEAKRGPV